MLSDWLDAHRPSETATPRLLHLDFHPINLIARHDGECVALDWSEADVGDIHADVATTILLMRHVTPGPLALTERLLSPVVRWVLERGYRRVYCRSTPLDEERLHYYLAWACLRRLAMYGMWLNAGPQCNGSKKCALERITPEHVAELEGCFATLTGVMPDLGRF
ncbi:MAG TPA: phosphotransferase [Gemmataceae bacterium]|nr:phosphotransferase [Gemmataceae bacterium]